MDIGRVAKLQLVVERLEHLIVGEESFISNMANASALIAREFTNLHWVGFYMWDAEKKQLVLGPFQGTPACVRIPYGKGVCGAAVMHNSTQIIQQITDTNYADSKIRSEIAIPMRQGRTIIGVLAADSESVMRFDKLDQDYLELMAARLVANHTM